MFKSSAQFFLFGLFLSLSSSTTDGRELSLGGRDSGLCLLWEKSAEAGTLDANLIPESSGLAFSRHYAKLYHVNDSGAGAEFFSTDHNGTHTQKVKIKGVKPRDAEEVAVGPCPIEAINQQRAASCIVIFDIGDNWGSRANIEAVFIQEQENFASEVTPVARLKMKYPDDSYNAEAAAIYPNGDIVVITKESLGIVRSYPAQVFRAKKSSYMSAIKSGTPVQLERIAFIDVPKLSATRGYKGLVTGISITSDGARFVLLTYQDAFEFQIDLSQYRAEPISPSVASLVTSPGEVGVSPELSRFVRHTKVQLEPLFQQEAIAYDLNDRDLLHSTEILKIKRAFFSNVAAPMRKTRCRRWSGNTFQHSNFALLQSSQ